MILQLAPSHECYNCYAMVKKQTARGVLASLMVLLLLPATGWAAQSASSSYQVNEVFFGAGGDLHDCSANYCAKTSAGETAIGNPTSPNYQARAGFNTDRTPYLQFIVNGTTTDIGVLNPGSTAKTTGSFSVKNYLSSGYSVITVSNPPKNGNHTLNALSTPTASSAGTEQFGINLVANTSPAAFGANPTQNPDSSFSFGAAASGYDTPNLYKYVPGDIIASSTKSSGETDYTISYIYNISATTPGGTYSFNDVLVATATF